MPRIVIMVAILVGAGTVGFVLVRLATRWGKNEAHGGNLFGPNDPGGSA